MNTAAIRKMSIMSVLSHIPESYLDNIEMYFDALTKDTWASSSENKSLKGIWKDAGFEKIVDLEGEIRDLRYEIQDGILARSL